MQPNTTATVAQRLLEISAGLGVDYLFTNLGSDHPAFIEAFARMQQSGGAAPRVIVCPHEMTALSAAHGYAMITRRPQMVLVHVDVGTQNLGGSVHNAARGRVPAIILAGLSPVTERGGPAGARNEFIHYIQDAPRQPEIVAQYMKWSYELRAPESLEAVLRRAVQISTTSPEGPVYITGAREIWEAAAPAVKEAGEAEHWPPAATAGLTTEAAAELYQWLIQARRPIVITSYLGRQRRAVDLLVQLSERIGIGVCEASPAYLNFPGSHPHHLGYRRNSFVDEADLILMLDLDVPWIPAKIQPAREAVLVHIDVDPLKTGLGLWHFPARRVYQADTLAVLEQLTAMAHDAAASSTAGRDARCDWIASKKRERAPAVQPGGAVSPAISPEELTEAVRELITERSVVLFEAPTCTELIPSILRLSRPGAYYNSGGAGLGWGINAAIGAKLADPASEVVALVGDGCYLFGVPSSAYWAAKTYRTPFLTVIYNNGGWQAPKFSTLLLHPEGAAKQNDTFWVTIGAGARLADVAAAAGAAAAFQANSRETLKATLREALEIVRSGRCAVVDAAITPASTQKLGDPRS